MILKKKYKMINILFYVSSIFLALTVFACSPPLNSTPFTRSQLAFASWENKTRIDDDCPEWSRAFYSLPEDRRKNLQEDKIIFMSDNSDHGYYIISKELVVECDLGVKIGNFLWRVQLGADSKADKEFASRYSFEITRVLRKVWDSKEFSSDGLHEAKYNLLGYEGLNDKDISLLLTDLIQKKIINIGLLVAIVENPIPSLKPALIESLTQVEAKKDLTQQLCYLISLEQISSSNNRLRKLQKIANDPNWDTKTKNSLLRIISKFKSGKKLANNDVLELPILDREENKSPQYY